MRASGQGVRVGGDEASCYAVLLCWFLSPIPTVYPAAFVTSTLELRRLGASVSRSSLLPPCLWLCFLAPLTLWHPLFLGSARA